MKLFLRASLLFLITALFYLPQMAMGQAVTIIHVFGEDSSNDGEYPEGLIQASDGSLYGVAHWGGSTAGDTVGPLSGYGMVFHLSTNGQYYILHSFNDGSVPNDGQGPNPGFVQGTDGNLYGTTQFGGYTVANDGEGYGTFYSVVPASGQTTILHMFGDGTVVNDGWYPDFLVQDKVPTSPTFDEYYGTTEFHGSANGGTIFTITPTGQVTILHSFQDGSVRNDGANPIYLVQDTNPSSQTYGSFYGETESGGSAGDGTIFRISPTGQVVILHSFRDGSVQNDGNEPFGQLVLAPDGNLYGVTLYGGAGVPGAFAPGTVFKMSLAGTETILHSFGDGTVTNDGFGPNSLVMGTDGNLYGATGSGGSTVAIDPLHDGYGTIFECATTGQITILRSFNDGTIANDGIGPGHLMQGTDGNFYGVTDYGGRSGVGLNGLGFGTIFEFAIPPQISNLAPNPVLAGGPSFPLNVSGNFFNPDAIVNFNGNPLPTTWGSSTQVTAAVPASDIGSGGTAQITVSNPSTLFINNPAPSITSLSPSSTVANSGGFTLTINGSGFDQSSTVTFGGATLTPASVTSTAITVDVPNADIQSTGTVIVAVTNPTPGGGSASTNFTITGTGLTITSLSPSSAVANSGAFSLTINGTNFTSSSTVTFGSDNLTPTSQTATALTVTVPNSDIQTAGNVTVTVTNPGTGGGSATATFTVTNPSPTITGLSPSSAAANSGSFTLTINGSGFTSGSAVSFGGNALAPTSVTSSAITVTVPNADIQTTGTVVVAVTNPSPGGGSASANFLVNNPAPVITVLSPTSGFANNGNFNLGIDGSGFISSSTVTFGGNTITPTSITSTNITMTIPAADAQTPGTVAVTVTNSGPGGGTASANFQLNNVSPQITGLSPSSAAANSGSFTLTISGGGFISGSSTVSFNGNALTPTSVATSAITVTVPNSDIQTAGTVTVSVTNPAPGGGTASANFTITAPNNPAPTITSLSPGSATVNSGGFTLTINGSGFISGSTVSFGGNALTPTSITSTAITVTIPNADIQTAGTASVTVTNPAPGGGSASASFTITTANNPAPTISSLSPSSASANSGNFTLTINGSNFLSSSTVSFGGNALTPTSMTSSAITVSVPNTDIQTAGTVTVSVTNPAPGGGTASATFTVSSSGGGSPPAVTLLSINPQALNGGVSTTGTVTLAGPVSAATPITFTISSPAVTIPPATMPAGQSTVNFPIDTSPVSTNTTVSITAFVGSTGKSNKILVYAPSISAISVSPTSVVGGTGTSTLTVTIGSAAPTGGCTVTLTSSDTTVLPLTSITVPAGATSVQMTLSPGTVTASEAITITGTANGASKKATLTVTP